MRSESPRTLPTDSIVLFSTADWDNPFWTNKQHMAFHLANRGYKVLYVESLGLRKVAANTGDWLRIFKRLQKFFSGAKKVHDGIWVLSPVLVPLHNIPVVKRFNDWFLKIQLRARMFRLGFRRPMAWTYNPLTLDLIQSLKFRFIVYHCVDDLAAAPRLPREKIESEEKRLLRAADVVFVTSEVLYEKLKPSARGLIRYYPNVADYEHFSEARNPELKVPADVQNLPVPRVGFVGAISSYKLDFTLISEAASLRPLWQWILIGKIGEGDPETNVDVLHKPNIHLVGPKPYEDLPAYLRAFDAVVLPCVINEYTKSMFPMKFFEYLAAGKQVVATDLPSLRLYRDVFTVANSAGEFVTALEKILSGEMKMENRADELARENTWDARLDRMIADLQSVMSPDGTAK